MTESLRRQDLVGHSLSHRLYPFTLRLISFVYALAHRRAPRPVAAEQISLHTYARYAKPCRSKILRSSTCLRSYMAGVSLLLGYGVIRARPTGAAAKRTPRQPCQLTWRLKGSGVTDGGTALDLQR